MKSIKYEQAFSFAIISYPIRIPNYSLRYERKIETDLNHHTCIGQLALFKHSLIRPTGEEIFQTLFLSHFFSIIQGKMGRGNLWQKKELWLEQELLNLIAAGVTTLRKATNKSNKLSMLWKHRALSFADFLWIITMQIQILGLSKQDAVTAMASLVKPVLKYFAISKCFNFVVAFYRFWFEINSLRTNP